MRGPGSQQRQVPTPRTFSRGTSWLPTPLCLLLLAQLMATTMTESPSGHSPRLSGPESCSPDEYWASSHCCKACPAGQYVENLCWTPHTWGKCGKCEQGTFTEFPNGLDACLLCSTCRDDQEEVQECSTTRNRRCQCRAGQFYQEPENLEFCSPCHRCPSGISILQACNATADTVCSSAAPSLHGGNWLGLIPGPVLGLILVILASLRITGIYIL